MSLFQLNSFAFRFKFIKNKSQRIRDNLISTDIYLYILFIRYHIFMCLHFKNKLVHFHSFKYVYIMLLLYSDVTCQLLKKNQTWKIGTREYITLRIIIFLNLEELRGKCNFCYVLISTHQESTFRRYTIFPILCDFMLPNFICLLILRIIKSSPITFVCHCVLPRFYNLSATARILQFHEICDNYLIQLVSYTMWDVEFLGRKYKSTKRRTKMLRC